LAKRGKSLSPLGIVNISPKFASFIIIGSSLLSKNSSALFGLKREIAKGTNPVYNFTAAFQAVMGNNRAFAENFISTMIDDTAWVF
jgi:hypothetical protein